MREREFAEAIELWWNHSIQGASHEHGYLVIRTPGIVMEGGGRNYYMGRANILIPSYRGSQPTDIVCLPAGYNSTTPGGDAPYWHPHVSCNSNLLCLGNSSYYMSEMCEKMDLVGLVICAWHLLQNYNASDCYQSIDRWRWNKKSIEYGRSEVGEEIPLWGGDHEQD